MAASAFIGLFLALGVFAALTVSFIIIGKNVGSSASAEQFKIALRNIMLCNFFAVIVLLGISFFFTATSQPSERVYLLIMTSLNLFISLNALGIGAMAQSQITKTVR
jgi:hypothetical protein